jgi:NitT/TauT family transport system permease protein
MSGWRGAVIPLGLIAAAQIAATATNLQSDLLAAPDQIVAAGIGALTDGTLANRTLQTLAMTGGGLLIGTVLGLALGIVLGLSRPAHYLAEFSVEAVRPIPPVALIPVAMLMFGFGYWMEITTVAFVAVWPVLILTRTAIAGIEPGLLDVSRVLGLSFFARTTKIVIPAALPRIFVAFRLATGMALTVAVTVEIAANPFGLGYEMISAQQSLHPALMFALLVWIGVIGWMVNAVMVAAQARWFGAAARVEAP